MLEIIAVEAGSIAEDLDLEPGDALLTMNGQPVGDLVDFLVYQDTEELLLEVRKADGELWDLELEKDRDDPLGLQFDHPVPSQCGNNCIFCFVHQLPRGMRSTLYVKDEDYRFSYLYGAYVTLTNISEVEIARIIRQHLSPLYVSVHATEEDLRQRLIGREGLPVLPLLRRLSEAGIELHTQIVLCPGINDGAELEKTIEDLAAVQPGIASLAVVPVGLTGYRQRLPELRTFAASEAQSVLTTLHRFQERFAAERGNRFVFAADEFYLKAGREFPPLANYGTLSQIENGVGMIPLFRQEAAEVLDEAEPLQGPAVSTFTGESAAGELDGFVRRLSEKIATPIALYPLRNEFFGGQVTVAGLLTGRDVLNQLRDKPLGSALLVPDVVLRDGEEVFLDDVTLHDLERELGVPVYMISSSPWGLLDGVEALVAGQE
jgi:putative radical SAM enzyme (TIGR03279 family)